MKSGVKILVERRLWKAVAVSRDFVLGRGAALGKIELNRPPFLGQFKQLFRWEFSNQVFAGFAHYYNI